MPDIQVALFLLAYNLLPNISSSLIAEATGGFVGAGVTVVGVGVVVDSSFDEPLLTYTITTTSITMIIANINDMRKYFLYGRFFLLPTSS